MNTQLSKFLVARRPLLAKLTVDLCLLSPGALLSTGLRRTGRTHGLHPTPLRGAANRRFSDAVGVGAEMWVGMIRVAGEA